MPDMAKNSAQSSQAMIGFVAAMAAVVVASNILVQYPLQVTIGGVNLKDLLTWGAFTYPVAFFITDLTNRRFGPSRARLVVAAGFLIAVGWSISLATPRIAIASGTAFLVAQLLDVSVFHRFRATAWWQAPLISSMVGSVVDTVLFFALAFAPLFGFLDFGGEDRSLGFLVPFLGVGSDVALWLSLAAGDFMVKILVGLLMLLPYAMVARRAATA